MDEVKKIKKIKKEIVDIILTGKMMLQRLGGGYERCPGWAETKALISVEVVEMLKKMKGFEVGEV